MNGSICLNVSLLGVAVWSGYLVFCAFAFIYLCLECAWSSRCQLHSAQTTSHFTNLRHNNNKLHSFNDRAGDWKLAHKSWRPALGECLCLVCLPLSGNFTAPTKRATTTLALVIPLHNDFSYVSALAVGKWVNARREIATRHRVTTVSATVRAHAQP